LNPLIVQKLRPLTEFTSLLIRLQATTQIVGCDVRVGDAVGWPLIVGSLEIVGSSDGTGVGDMVGIDKPHVAHCEVGSSIIVK
jgi:hypothetical protein